jgi:hypothetical protein
MSLLPFQRSPIQAYLCTIWYKFNDIKLLNQSEINVRALDNKICFVYQANVKADMRFLARDYQGLVLQNFLRP